MKNTPHNPFKGALRISLFLLIASVFAQIVGAQSHPRVMTSQAKIAAILDRVAAGDAPFTAAFAKALDDANAALGQKSLSVVWSGGSTHDYYTMRPYDWSNNMPSPCGSTTCDGQVNPKADRADYAAAIEFSKAVRA